MYEYWTRCINAGRESKHIAQHRRQDGKILPQAKTDKRQGTGMLWMIFSQKNASINKPINRLNMRKLRNSRGGEFGEDSTSSLTKPVGPNPRHHRELSGE